MAMDTKNMSPDILVTPGTSFMLITASATAFTQNTRAIYVDTAGTADWTDADGNTATAVNLVAGSVIPVQLSKVTALSSAKIYAIR
jgi:hypothetical protein